MIRRLILVGGLLVCSTTSAQISGQMDERDPIVAASMVLSSASALERFEEFCQARHPRIATLVSDTRQQWMEQHQALYEQAQIVVEALLTFAQRNSLRLRQQAENDRIVSTVSEATAAESFEFCTGVNARFQAPGAILTNHEQLVATLENFSP